MNTNQPRPLVHSAIGNGKTACGLSAFEVKTGTMVTCNDCLREELKDFAPKHTPGPWVADKQSVVAPNEIGSAKAVADMCYNIRTIETAQANATLIASAPELLDALQWVVGPETDCPKCERVSGRCLGHSAIAKAEGRE